MDKINDSISKNLRQFRKEKGLTLEDLSEICGVSKSMLGEIERGSTNPTILVLWKIAEGLKIPLTALIREEESDYAVVRNNELKVIDQTTGYGIFSIFPYYEQHKSEMLALEIQPEARIYNNGHMDGVDEYIFVIRGDIKLILNNEEFILHEGDSMRFKGNLPHELINCYENKASMINILNYK